MKKTNGFLPLALVPLLGCASSQVMRSDTVPRRQKSPDQVVFLVQKPDKPFKVIAVVKVSDQGWGMDTSNRLRQEAAKLGGDAVILTGASQATSAGAAYSGGVFAGVMVPVKDQGAQVIVFEQPPSPAADRRTPTAGPEAIPTEGDAAQATPEPTQRSPTEVRSGMTPAEVESALGQPERKATLDAKAIYWYPGMKITFVDGKVTDVE